MALCSSHLCHKFLLDLKVASQTSQVPVLYFHYHAMDLDPGRAGKYSSFFFAFPCAAFPKHEVGQPLQLYNISELYTFTCVMA